MYFESKGIWVLLRKIWCQFLCHVLPSAMVIIGIRPTLSPSCVGPYSSDAHGLEHYPRDEIYLV